MRSHRGGDRLPQPLSFRPARRAGTPRLRLNRIDATRGYSINNVWWVHKDIGGMKMDLPRDRFVDLCRMVAEHRESAPADRSDLECGRVPADADRPAHGSAIA